MTDVLRIALDRRDQLHAEIEKLDEFIRVAEQLIRSSQRGPGQIDDSEHKGSSRVNLLRRGTQAAVG
jgi:hypothetical protein